MAPLSLIEAGALPSGDVLCVDAAEISAGDVERYRQVHFFAGIGGWAYALTLAGWPDDRSVWTGSCPCQPFSAAGQQRGFDDARHLWPAWFRLIEQCAPPIVFGEQVAPALAWLDLVQDDMEGAGYAFGAADLCAAGVGAPHIRQRLYFGAVRRVGHANDSRPQGRIERRVGTDKRATRTAGVVGRLARAGGGMPPGADYDFWQDADWLRCRDDKWRPVEPSTFPLAHGVPARVGRLRGYGNAIVPQVAAAFVRAFISAARESERSSDA